MLEFEKKLAAFIKTNGLFSFAEKVLLAVSGGADSTALLYTIFALKNQKVLSVELFCAHINHQLRAAEADTDERFVVAQTTDLNLPIVTKRVDVRSFAYQNKLSIETAARQLRIESLLDIAKANNCDRIATGHQKNDNAETVLQRLSRGTGFRGLGGIWPMRTFNDKIKFIRPLLCVTRDEIIKYLKERNLTWQTDHTNADCSYRRNYIRHRLLPSLQQQGESCLVEQLCGLSQSAQRFYSLVCSRAENAWTRLADFTDDKISLNLRDFLTEPEPVKIELIRRCLTNLGSGERELTQQHYEKILRLAKQNVSGKKIELPNGFVARREYKNLIFERYKKENVYSNTICSSTELKVPGRTQYGQYLIEATVIEAAKRYLAPSFIVKMPYGTGGFTSKFIEGFDLDKVKLPLIIRFRQDGDRFWPLGLAGQKKVGKFMTTVQVPQDVRAKVLIVTDREKIIWIWPIQMSEQAKITSTTQKILQLQITEMKFNHRRTGDG